MKKRRRRSRSLRGVCHFHSETGTEGGFWAFQDEKFISPPCAEFPKGQWSYKGLHILKDGDRLTIYDKNDYQKVVWRGVIKLKQYSVFTQDAFGLWIHTDQEGLDRKVWARYFFDEHPAILEY